DSILRIGFIRFEYTLPLPPGPTSFTERNWSRNRFRSTTERFKWQTLGFDCNFEKYAPPMSGFTLIIDVPIAVPWLLSTILPALWLRQYLRRRRITAQGLEPQMIAEEQGNSDNRLKSAAQTIPQSSSPTRQ